MAENCTTVSTWVTPTCEIISVSMECTAYAAALNVDHATIDVQAEDRRYIHNDVR